MVRWSVTLVAVVGLVLVACGERPAGEDVGAALVASEATLPAMDEFAHADIVSTEDDLDLVWRRFGLPADPPSVDLEETVLLFAGFGESSSCPATFEGVYVDDEHDVVSLLTGQDGTACTDDFSPRTYVVSVDRDVLPEAGFVFDLAREDQRSRGSFVLSTTRTETPPDGPPVFRVLASDAEPTGLRAEVVPSSVVSGDPADIIIHNPGEEAIRTGGPMRILDRWRERRWVPADDQPDHGPHPGLSIRHDARVGAGERDGIGSVDTEGLDPGWYAVRISLSLDGSGGRVDLRTHLEVLP